MWPRTGQNLAARTLDMHRLIVAKIKQDPALFECFRSTLARWRRIVDERSQPYLVEWERLANVGMDECLRVAAEDSEYAAALRRSSPFCGILSEPERLEFLRTWHQSPD